MKNPWSRPAPPYYGRDGVVTACVVECRVDMVKTMTREQLVAARTWPENQKAVNQAIDRRLRKLAKEVA